MSTEFSLQITSFLVVFVSLLLAFFLLTVKSKNKQGNSLLAIYLIIRAIDVSVYFYYGAIDLPLEIELLRMDVGSFLKIPLLYLFVLSILYTDFKLRKKDLWHTVPFLVVTAVQFPLFYVAEESTQQNFITHYLYHPAGLFSTILAHLQHLFYLLLIFKQLRNYRTIRFNNYAIADDYNYKWLLQMNLFLIGLFGIAVIKNALKYVDSTDELLVLRLCVAIGMLFFTCWLVLKALYAPNIFSGIHATLPTHMNQSQRENDNSENAVFADLITQHMKEQKPFLNPEFTIQELSTQINQDSREISLLLNQYLHQNFYEFVNHYRIEEAKKVLIEQKKSTVQEVLYQVGFNSKSSFNTQFKKATGFTPTEFRKRNA